MSSNNGMNDVTWGDRDGNSLWMDQWLDTDEATMFLVVH